jgi:predicted lipase
MDDSLQFALDILDCNIACYALNTNTHVGSAKLKDLIGKSESEMWSDWVTGLQVTSVFHDYQSDLDACILVSHSQKRIILVFRGTESMKDVIGDLQICRSLIRDNEHGVKVHSGFKHQLFDGGMYNKIKDELLYTLKLYPSYSLCVTGHSLGGALATLFVYTLYTYDLTYAPESKWDVDEDFMKRSVLLTFACPKVGNNKWCEEFHRTRIRHLRYVNAMDIVPQFPSFHYYHVGTLRHIHAGKIHARKPFSWYNFYNFRDHTCLAYKEHLQIALARSTTNI